MHACPTGLHRVGIGQAVSCVNLRPASGIHPALQFVAFRAVCGLPGNIDRMANHGGTWNCDGRHTGNCILKYIIVVSTNSVFWIGIFGFTGHIFNVHALLFYGLDTIIDWIEDFPRECIRYSIRQITRARNPACCFVNSVRFFRVIHTVSGHGSINGIWVLSCVILPTHFKCVIEGIFPTHSAKGIALTNPKIIDIPLFRGMRRVIFLIFDIQVVFSPDIDLCNYPSPPVPV